MSWLMYDLVLLWTEGVRASLPPGLGFCLCAQFPRCPGEVLTSYGSSVFSFGKRRTVLCCRGTKFLSHQLCRSVPLLYSPSSASVTWRLFGGGHSWLGWGGTALQLWSLSYSATETQMLTWRPLLPFEVARPRHSPHHHTDPGSVELLGSLAPPSWPTRMEVIQAAGTLTLSSRSAILSLTRRSCPVSGAPLFRGLCHTAESQWKHTSIDLWRNQEWMGGGWNIALNTFHLLPVLGSIDGDACRVLFLFVPFYLIPVVSTGNNFPLTH